jgi:hypothetical protein
VKYRPSHTLVLPSRCVCVVLLVLSTACGSVAVRQPRHCTADPLPAEPTGKHRRRGSGRTVSEKTTGTHGHMGVCACVVVVCASVWGARHPWLRLRLWARAPSFDAQTTARPNRTRADLPFAPPLPTRVAHTPMRICAHTRCARVWRSVLLFVGGVLCGWMGHRRETTEQRPARPTRERSRAHTHSDGHNEARAAVADCTNTMTTSRAVGAMGARRPLCLLRLALLLLAAAVVLVPSVHAASSSACAFGDPECTLYIADLDRSDFLKAFLMFGIPCVRWPRRCKLQTRLSACQSHSCTNACIALPHASRSLNYDGVANVRLAQSTHPWPWPTASRERTVGSHCSLCVLHRLLCGCARCLDCMRLSGWLGVPPRSVQSAPPSFRRLVVARIQPAHG